MLVFQRLWLTTIFPGTNYDERLIVSVSSFLSKLQLSFSIIIGEFKATVFYYVLSNHALLKALRYKEEIG